jgi:hypothetical protein
MPTKLPAHAWRRPRNARNWTTGASFRDHTTCECLLGHLYGAVPSALSSLELDPHKQTPGRLSARSRGSTHKVRHRPRRLRPQQAPRMPTPEKAPNPNFSGPQRRSPPAHAPAAARRAPESAPKRDRTSKVPAAKPRAGLAPRTAGRPRGMRSLRDGEEQQAGPPARSEQATRVRQRRRPGCSRAQRHLRGQRRRARAPNSARRAAGSIPRAQVGHAPHHLDRRPLVPRQRRRRPPSVGPIFYFKENHLRGYLVLP